MESAASHSHPLLLTSEPSKQQSASTNDEGTSRKRSAAEDSSEKPPLAPTKRGRSQYWKHFEKTMKKTSQGERKIGICNYCKSEVPTLTGSTTGLKYHLEKKCELSPFYAASGNNKGQTVLTKETMGKGNEVSFRAVEGKGFVALVHELEPRFRIPDRKKVAVSVKKLKRFGDSNQEVRELCDRFKNDLVTLWAEYKGVSDTLVTQKPLLENSGDRDDTGLGGSGLFDELYNGVQEEVSQDQLNQISNEVDNLYKDPTDDDLAFYQEIEEIEKIAVNDVARVVRAAELDSPPADRLLQRIDASLGVVGEHGHLVGGGGQRLGRGFGGGGGAQCGGGVERGDEDGAAAGAVELDGGVIGVGAVVGVGATCGFDVAEELFGEVEGAGGGVGLLREGGDGGDVIGFELFASLIIDSFMELEVLGFGLSVVLDVSWIEESSLNIMHSRCLVIFPIWKLVAKS
ncbi:hypothetical protein SASPL_152384 [Salvia splendens]|uniref:BED-type domain-containing protein n=1 Tax=Salvia splendens TaxID=180675 RepID=A0A8X8W398_SALSN|nr:hypothetical protein SASPL_152384 [Salvia splendens]